MSSAYRHIEPEAFISRVNTQSDRRPRVCRFYLYILELKSQDYNSILSPTPLIGSKFCKHPGGSVGDMPK